MSEGGTIRELVTKWGFQVDQDKIDRLDKTIDRLKGTTTAVAAGLGAVAAAFVGVVVWSAKTGDEIAKAADRAGVTVEALQRLRYAGSMAGVEVGQMGMALQFLAKNARDAADGTGEAAKVFEKLEVSVESGGTLRELPDILLDVAEAIATMEDKGSRVNYVMRIFGRSGAALIPFLKDGRDGIRQMMEEADALGIVMGDKQARASERFSDSLDRIQWALLGLKNTIGGAFLDEGTALMDRLIEWYKANRKLVQERLTEAMRGIAKVLKAVGTGVWDLIGGVGKLVDALGGLDNALALVKVALVWYLGAKVAAFTMEAVSAVMALTAAFRTAGTAAMLMNAKIALIPILLGLAGAALYLILDDLQTWREGGDSVFGDLLALIKEWSEALFGIDASKPLAGFFDFMIDRAVVLKDNLNDVLRLITSIGDASAWGIFKRILNRSLPDMTSTEGLTGTTPGAMLGRQQNEAAGIMGPQIRVTSPITINVSGGAALENAKAVEVQLDSWWDRKMREAMNLYPAGVSR